MAQQQQTPFFQLPAIAKLPKILSQQSPVDQVQAADPTTAGPEYTQFALSQAKPKGSGAPRNVGEGLTYIGEKINEAAWRGEYLKALQGQKTADAAAWGNYTQALTGGNSQGGSPAPGTPSPPKGLLSSPPTPPTGPNNGYTPAPEMKAGPAIAGGDLANAAGGNVAQGIPGASDPTRDGDAGAPAIAKGGMLSAPPSMPKPLQAPAQGMAPEQPAQPSDEQMRSMTGATANAAPQPETQPAQPQAQAQPNADPRLAMYDKQIATLNGQMQAAQGLIRNPGTRDQGLALLNGLSTKVNALEMAKIELQNPANETSRRMNEAHATLYEAQAKKALGAAGNETEQRSRDAERFGLKPGTGQYQAYVLTGKLPGEDATKLTPQDRKSIQEADEMVAANRATIQTVGEAEKLNPQANSGWFPETRAMLANNLPDWMVPDAIIGSPQNGQATVDFKNLTVGQALSQLKTTFGASPTEGERQILMDLQGSVNMTPENRGKILQRAREAAQKRLVFEQEKANQLRGGTYYKVGQGPSEYKDQGSPSGPVRVSSPEEAASLPSGTKFITPDGREMVKH